MLLKDKVIVITGGSQGLGQAIAKRLACDGAYIWVLSRIETHLLKVVNEIRSNGGKANFCIVDITSKLAIEDCIGRILNKHSQIDVLINCAGIWLQGPTEESSQEKVRDVFKVNTIGTIYATQVILSSMRRYSAGHIINIISTAGIEPNRDWGIYAASKYGGRGFTDSLKLELEGSGIKVTGFYPGGMSTDFYKKAGQSYAIDEPWMMAVEDIADIVHYLLIQPDDVVIDHIEVRKVMRYTK